MPVYVSGHSDDLIEIDGDLSEEFPYDEDEDNFVAFSNGIVLKIAYKGDHWSVWVVANPLKHRVDIEQGSEESDWAAYSDRASFDAPASWVLHGVNWAER